MDHFDSPLIIRVEQPPGNDLKDSWSRAVALSKQLNVQVKMDHNGIDILIFWSTTYEQVIEFLEEQKTYRRKHGIK